MAPRQHVLDGLHIGTTWQMRFNCLCNGDVAFLSNYCDHLFVNESCDVLVMVALCNRADHYIFALWLLLSFFLLFFRRLISAVADWMSAILPHMVWP